MTDQSKCCIMSLNVRGLRNRVKRSSIFSFLRDQNCQFYFLQEIYSEQKDENVWRNEWGGDIFFSHSSTPEEVGHGPDCIMGQILNFAHLTETVAP